LEWCCHEALAFGASTTAEGDLSDAPGLTSGNAGLPRAEELQLAIEIGGRMDEVCESCHKVF
jgi:hypothetical protein